jgi:uncharacterized protein (TIGR02453 family)
MKVGKPAKARKPARTSLPKETLAFFRGLSRNNRKDWMDANRERYRQQVVEPLRELLDTLTSAVLALDPRFVITGRTGMNFSRINRDIRFAKDKTPYHARLYVIFPDSPDGEGGQLYIGVSPDTVTAGFRIYGGSNVKNSPLGKIGQQRALANPKWLAKQKSRLGRKYESYWHSVEKGVWTKNPGWPEAPEDWKKLRAWIVRRAMKPVAATRPGFVRGVTTVFLDVVPLCQFVSSPKWKP